MELNKSNMRIDLRIRVFRKITDLDRQSEGRSEGRETETAKQKDEVV